MTGGFAPDCVYAAPEPVTVSAIFADAAPTKVAAPKDISHCALRIVELSDLRKSPEMLGVYVKRAVYAPQDRSVWLRSIVGGLESRGLTLTLSDEPAPNESAIEAKVALQLAWLTDTVGNISAIAVFHVEAQSSSGKIDKFERGAGSKMTYWSLGSSAGQGMIQAAVDSAFSKALDAIATDLYPLCRS
jgi:hypothetical protein